MQYFSEIIGIQDFFMTISLLFLNQEFKNNSESWMYKIIYQ